MFQKTQMPREGNSRPYRPGLQCQSMQQVLALWNATIAVAKEFPNVKFGTLLSGYKRADNVSNLF